MTEAITTLVKSAIFGTRNVDKAEDGHIGRAGVAVGQAKRVVDSILQFDETTAKGAQSAVKAVRSIVNEFENAAKTEKVLDYAGKAVNFASKNVNPLLCVSAGIDILTSDDKKSALVTNGTALATMFAAENHMSKNLDSIIENTANKISKIGEKNGIVGKICKSVENVKHAGKIPAILHGLLFVAGSCTAYGLGESFGKLLLGQPNKA